MGADLVTFPELVVSGYPPEDLLLKPEFIEKTMDVVEELIQATKEGPGILLTTPWFEEGHLYNGALLADGGVVNGIAFKAELPNYGVFDEKRVFKAPKDVHPINFRNILVGVPICEDIWFPTVVERLREQGAELLIVPNGSPYELEKFDRRLALARQRVTESSLPLIYLNQVGGQDELVFDGGSFVMNADGSRPVQLPHWEEFVVATDWVRTVGSWSCRETEGALSLSDEENVYQAMMMGLRDYVLKNRFKGVVLGMSGGIDSALSAVVAVDALGADKVRLIRLPSRFTSEESQVDAEECANRLKVPIDTIPIDVMVRSTEQAFAHLFAGTSHDTTEENIQARLRGLTLMAFSNKFGYMVLTTGNKSEMSVGYATLYGDMCGGYSVLKDVYKTWVYRISQWRNKNRPYGAKGPSGYVIPENIIVKAPTAELRPGQKDQDTLPPYDDLDKMLEMLVEEESSIDQLVEAGFDRSLVEKVEKMLRLAEYKRRQAPPGVKVTRRSFGRDRRYPITNGFKVNE
jgi:NAD+ synthase